MEERTLVQKLQKGDTGALEALIRRYTPYVSACAYRVMGSLPREELEEAVADTFVALWRHAGDLDPEKSLHPWLGTVAANKARDPAALLLPRLPHSRRDPRPGRYPTADRGAGDGKSPLAAGRPSG